MTVASRPDMETILVADFGRGFSRGYIIEHIGGTFRFVAKAEQPTSSDLPFADLSTGWRSLLSELSWITGRDLAVKERLSMPSFANGDGVDALLCCSTLAPPARMLILEAGVNSGTAAIIENLQRTHTKLMHAVAPSGRKDGGWITENLAAVRAFSPEMIIFIASGASDALMRAVQLVRQASPIESLSRAVVIADGAMQDQASAAFEGIRVRKISPAARESSSIAAEIERELMEAFRQRSTTPDFKQIAQDAVGGVISRAHAVDLVNRFVARSFGRKAIALSIDDGSHVHWASGDQGAMAALPDIDLASAITNLSDKDVTDAVNWLPFEAQASELVTWVLNRSIRPWTVADQPRDKAIEQALARQIIRRALAEIQKTRPTSLSDVDLVIGSPRFADWGQPGAAALTLLDSIDQVPNEGVLDLALDRDGLMVAAGAISTVNAEIAANIFEHDALLHLGSAVIIGGATHEGDLACRGEIRYASGDASQFSVASGTIEVLPLRPGETASLVLRPERKYSVGGHPSGETFHLSGDRQLVGGVVGIIIDARARPLMAGGPGRQAKVKQWLDAVNRTRLSSIRRAP